MAGIAVFSNVPGLLDSCTPDVQTYEPIVLFNGVEQEAVSISDTIPDIFENYNAEIFHRQAALGSVISFDMNFYEGSQGNCQYSTSYEY